MIIEGAHTQGSLKAIHNLPPGFQTKDTALIVVLQGHRISKMKIELQRNRRKKPQSLI